MKLTLIQWLEERKANALRIADLKTGEDRAGWLEDARYFELAIEAARTSRDIWG